jgi:hypothetical protein
MDDQIRNNKHNNNNIPLIQGKIITYLLITDIKKQNKKRESDKLSLRKKKINEDYLIRRFKQNNNSDNDENYIKVDPSKLCLSKEICEQTFIDKVKFLYK